MSWQDRQREAALTTPDGTRFTFLYEDLERNRSENASVFRFAEKSGAFIQRLSSGQDIYPLSIIFSGEDYDLIAADFWERTKLPGVFSLEHPRFKGPLRVQLLTIRQRIAAKTSDNQTTFDAVFHETLELSAPETARDLTALVLQSTENLNAEAAESFTDNVKLEKFSEVTKTQSKFDKFIDSVNDKLEFIAAKEAAIKTAFDAQFLSAKSAVERLVAAPLELANNVTSFVNSVSRTAIDVKQRINAFEELANETLDEFSTVTQDFIDTVVNNASLVVLTVNSLLGAMSQSAVSNASYGSKIDVIEVVDQIIDISDSTIALLDEYVEEINAEEDPANRRFEITDAINNHNELISTVTAQLFAIAFTLKQERIITLDRPRDPITLTHELYGFTEDNLTLLIESNFLKGEELFEIPQGKDIVYFI